MGDIQFHYQVKKMLMQTVNLENLMITQSGPSGRVPVFFIRLYNCMKCHQLTFFFYLESIKRCPVMFHGDHIRRHNLWKPSLTPGLK